MKERLSERQVASLVKAGVPISAKTGTTPRARYYPDGAGLFLRVARPGVATWAYRYIVEGRQHEMGFGPYPYITIKEARQKAEEVRDQRAHKIDPLAARQAQDDTLRKVATLFLENQRPKWRNSKYAEDVVSLLERYAFPAYGNVSVAAIDRKAVQKILEPIWNKIPDTASKLREKLEAILAFATVKGYRSGDNPAKWEGNLEHLGLPSLSEIKKAKGVKHHAALDFAEMPEFMTRLRKQVGTAARALEFLILTAARTNEVMGARWDEIDFADKVWSIPGQRMKGGKEHRVPLSARAIEILEGYRGQDKELVFPFPRGGNGAMGAVLKRMKLKATVHGFRSTFRDWVTEETSFLPEMAEVALAHLAANKTEQAYWRKDLLEKRREMMAQWARAIGELQ